MTNTKNSKETKEQPTQVTNVSGGVNVHADQVNIDGDLVGRDKITQNIRQLILKPWAWLIGVVILAVALILVAGIFNVGQLQALLPTPTPAPTPLAFFPASSDQSLIIVADFDDRSNGRYKGIDPAQYIFEQLVAQTQQDNLNVRIERLPQVVSDGTVRPTGKIYSATLVVWGWYDALTITPRMERIKTLSDYRSSEEGQHLSLSDPTKLEFSIVTDLSSQSTYLVLFALGLEAYTDPARSFDEALSYFANAIVSLPAEVAVTTNPAEAYFFSGNVYLSRSDPDQAIADYAKAIQLRPDYADAYTNRGLAYDDIGDYDRAIVDFDQAIQLKPDSTEAYTNRGAAYAHTGDYDRAFADYAKAIQLRPDNADAHYNRGVAYADKGDYDRALADYDKAIQLSPDYANAYSNRGLAYARTGDYDRAITDYAKAIQLNPDDVEAYNNRGVAYYHQNDYDRAIANFDKAIHLQPNLAQPYAARGYAYEQKGNKDKAIADYKKFLELSDDPNLRQQIQNQLKALGAK